MRVAPVFQGQQSALPGISELGFGCAAMGGSVSRKTSLAALNAAYDAGITLYDTARSYGYGQSESILGEFLRGRRERIVVCTKFGILPAHAAWKQHLKPAARAALRFFPGIKAAMRRQAGDQLSHGHFGVATLRSSFEISLRELGTDYVDILLMHAAPASALEQDDLLEALGRLIEAGQVLRAGISGDQAVLQQYFLARPKQLATCQFSLNFSNLEFVKETVRNSDLLMVGNHPFGGATGIARCRAALLALRNDSRLPSLLKEKLAVNDSQLLPELVLNCVLRGTGLTAVTAAMMRAEHIQSNVRAVEQCRFDLAELSLLRQALSESAPRFASADR